MNFRSHTPCLVKTLRSLVDYQNTELHTIQHVRLLGSYYAPAVHDLTRLSCLAVTCCTIAVKIPLIKLNRLT
jgi:hypothetical protein